MYVRDLIDTSTMQWDRKIFFWLVCSQDSDGNTCNASIENFRAWHLELHLLRTSELDTLNWTENTTNVFTVKSAYRVVLRMKERSRIEHSTAGQYRHHWKKIWTLNVPPKVRNFLRHACSNILPTRENLSRLKVSVEPHCEFCCQLSESVGHLLWECPFARNVWAMCWGKLQKCSNEAREFFNLFKLLVEKLPQLELEAGQWCLGQYGKQGMNSTLTESNSIQKSS